MQSVADVQRERCTPRLARADLTCAALVTVFVFAGLTGHDPWKADEAYVFGVVQHMLESPDWLVPTLAGEPFMEKPPLFYWAAAVVARALSPWLAVHDGARVTSGLFMLVNAALVWIAARQWWGRDLARHAPLVLIGCLGMVVQSHSMMPDLSLLTGFALAALGFALVLRLPVRGGLLIGLGTGVGFLSKGLIAPGAIGATALLLPICFATWRTRAYGRGLLSAALVGLPFCTVWPALLYLRSPALFREWFWENNIGRFVGFSVWRLRTEHTPWLWSQTIPWFTFPGLPLALFALWRHRSRVWSEPPVQYALIAFAVLMSILALSSSAREVYAWPLLVPVSILAAPAAAALPARLERYWESANAVLFGALCLAVVGTWCAMMALGRPPGWPLLQRYLPADFAPQLELVRVVLAAALIAGAGRFIALARPLPGKGLATWVAGLSLLWALLMTLFTPWFDYAKSYRPVFAAMPLPAPGECLASIGLGESERAMLHYVTGRDPVRREVAPQAACPYLLVQREPTFGPLTIDPAQWRVIWQGKRPGRAKERFILYRSTTLRTVRPSR